MTEIKRSYLTIYRQPKYKHGTQKQTSTYVLVVWRDEAEAEDQDLCTHVTSTYVSDRMKIHPTWFEFEFPATLTDGASAAQSTGHDKYPVTPNCLARVCAEFAALPALVNQYTYVLEEGRSSDSSVSAIMEMEFARRGVVLLNGWN